MVYPDELKGRYVTLSSITEDDAEFSYKLRSDERFVKTMGQPASSVEAQREYIRKQREKEGDYYFVVRDRLGERIGLIGVYDIHDGKAELGRELNIGAPTETMEAEVLLIDFCRDVLHIKEFNAVVYKNNKKVIRMHHKRGEDPVGEVVRSGVEAYEYRSTMAEKEKSMGYVRALLDSIGEEQK